MDKSFIGTFYIPTLTEQESISRTYSGYGDPNLLDLHYFQPSPMPGDKYLQLDVIPIIEWIYVQYGFWMEASRVFDATPPDYTLIKDVR